MKNKSSKPRKNLSKEEQKKKERIEALLRDRGFKVPLAGTPKS